MHAYKAEPEIQEDFALCLASSDNAGIENNDFFNPRAFLKKKQIYGCASLPVE